MYRGLFVIFCLLASVAKAEDRFALVVGNSDYGNITKVNNAVPSAELIAARLAASGFDVEILLDADLVEMKRGIANYGQRIRAAEPDDIGVLFYSGHGVNAFGDNFLLPTDAKIGTAEDLDFVAINAGTLLFALNTGSRAKHMLILDCCVQNPIPDVPDMGTTGMLLRAAPDDNILVFATQPEGVLQDSETASPFAVGLDLAMSIPQMPIEGALQLVQSSMASDFGADNTPYVAAALSNSFILNEAAPAVENTPDDVVASVEPEVAEPVTAEPAAAEPTVEERVEVEEPAPVAEAQPEPVVEAPAAIETAEAPAVEQPANIEDAAWAAAKVSGDSTIVLAFLQAYPTGSHVEDAKVVLLDLLEKELAPEENIQTAAVTPELDPSTRSVNSESAVPTSVFYDVPLSVGDAAIVGKTIAEIVKGSPLFPPVEGLPESYWKEEQCSNCHMWTQDDLCTQAQFYLTDAGLNNLKKQHPLGGTFKQNLKVWAEGGCR